MVYFDIGEEISMRDYNSLVYLLRKFKRLTSPLKLGALTLESDYGTFTFDKPLTSVGSNFILEQPVNISSSNCLKNCFYSFVFSVIDVNTSGTVNKRQVKVTGNTGENGTLAITLPTDLINADEVILPYFELDIVFDPHEYYTSVVDAVKVDLESDKSYVLEDETATITATLTNKDGEPFASVPCTFVVNGEAYAKTTDENGQAEFKYTGTGNYSKIDIQVITTTLTIFDTPLTATINGNSVRFFGGNLIWLETDGDCIINWGDDTTTTVNNPTQDLTHNYTDSEQNHTIAFLGVVTGLGNTCFMSEPITSVNIPPTVTSFGNYCFMLVNGLTSIIIPNTITNIGKNCFKGCNNLVDYQLYWLDDTIIPYDSNKMPNNANTVFTIPNGQTSNYVAHGYPSAKISERAGIITVLSISSSKSTYYTDETITITGGLVDDDNNPLSNASVKIYQNNALLGTVTTDSNGGYTKTLTGLNVGAYTFKAMYDGDSTYEASTSSDCSITVQNHTYSVSLAVDKQIIYTDESIILSGVMLHDGSAWAGQSVDLYDGANLIDTLTTDSSGNYSKTLTGLTVGTHAFKVVNSNVESNTVSVTIIEHDYSLAIASTKDILSHADSESATITGTLTDGGVAVAGETLSYAIKHGSTTISTGSDTTDSNGQISVVYASTGVGDVTVEVNYGSSLQETYEIEDCYDSITGQTDELTKFGSSISLRNSGGSTLSYDSTNKYYKWSLTKNNSESFIPINNATGLNDFTIEFDAYLQSGSGLAVAGLTTYKDSNDWLRFTNIYNKKSYYLMSNGSGSEQEVNARNIQNQWVHFKFTITDNTVSKEIYSNNELVDSASQQLSSSVFISTTKYGIPTLWGTSWNNLTYLKNFKVKAL